MLAKMIDKIVSLKETKTFEIGGQTYTDGHLTLVPVHVDRPECITVSGLDGICQLIRTELAKSYKTVEARQGIALKERVEVRPRVVLQPFRTFLEVDQPESEFLLRVDAEKGVGLFEADGGVWKLEAKKNIAAYFAKSLSGLIEAGQVVIMC